MPSPHAFLWKVVHLSARGTGTALLVGVAACAPWSRSHRALELPQPVPSARVERGSGPDQVSLVLDVVARNDTRRTMEFSGGWGGPPFELEVEEAGHWRRALARAGGPAIGNGPAGFTVEPGESRATRVSFGGLGASWTGALPGRYRVVLRGGIVRGRLWPGGPVKWISAPFDLRADTVAK